MLPQDSLGLIQPVIWHEWKRWTEFCSPHKWVKYLHSWVYRDKVLLTALLTGGLFLVVKLNCFFTSRLHCANLRVMLVMSSVLMTLRLHSSLFLGLSLRCPTIIFFLWWEEIWGLLALRSYLYYTKIFSFPCLNLGSTPVDIGWFSVACPLCFGFFFISKFCSEKKPRLKKILPSSQLLRGHRSASIRYSFQNQVQVAWFGVLEETQFAEFTEPHGRFGFEFVWNCPEIFLTPCDHRRHPEGIFLLFSCFTTTGLPPFCLKRPSTV